MKKQYNLEGYQCRECNKIVLRDKELELLNYNLEGICPDCFIKRTNMYYEKPKDI